MKFSYEHISGVTMQQLATVKHVLTTELARINHAKSRGYDTPYAFVHAPYDAALLHRIEELAEQKKSLRPTMLVLVGIGGSSLGTLALYEALMPVGMRFVCADTIGAVYTKEIMGKIEQEITQGGSIICVIISKSGTTTETLINAGLIFALLKKQYSQDYTERIVIISDENSPLWDLAHHEHFATLTVPQQLGGRFSVFSAVGLFPLALLGIDIKELVRGARAQVDACLTDTTATSDAAVSASILYLQYHAGKNVHDTFVFAPQLASLGAWYRQLMGESIGKQRTSDDKIIAVGITPTVSCATNDLHSVAQLYLAGPQDKITTMLYTHEAESLTIPDNIFTQLGTVGAGNNIAFVQDAIFHGVCTAYQQAQRPYVTINLNSQSAYDLGQFMYMKMFEIVLLGALLEINPFDQPQVELYKRATRAQLIS